MPGAHSQRQSIAGVGMVFGCLGGQVAVHLAVQGLGTKLYYSFETFGGISGFSD